MSRELQKVLAQETERQEPPFRAEHIGSLLRPKALLEARARRARGEIAQSELTAIEDSAIRGAIALQEQLGFRFVTDGEFRRSSYHSFFYQQLGDISIDVAGGDGKDSAGQRVAQSTAMIKSRVQWSHPINVGDFEKLKRRAALVSTAVKDPHFYLFSRSGFTDALVLLKNQLPNLHLISYDDVRNLNRPI